MEARSNDKNKQNVLIMLEMQVTALFFFSIRASALLRNNPLGNENFSEWVLAGSVNTFSQFIPNSPWDWSAEFVTEVFNWDNSALNQQVDEAGRRKLVRDEDVPAPPSPECLISFQFFNLFADLFAELEEFWNNTILPALNSIIQAIEEVLGQIRDFVENLVTDVKEFFEPLVNVIDDCTVSDILSNPQGCLASVDTAISSYGQK